MNGGDEIKEGKEGQLPRIGGREKKKKK